MAYDMSTLESSRPLAPRPGGRLALFAALVLVGILVLVAGIVPLIDGMPLFKFPATTEQAAFCVLAGLVLCLYGATQLIKEVFRLARQDSRRA